MPSRRLIPAATLATMTTTAIAIGSLKLSREPVSPAWCPSTSGRQPFRSLSRSSTDRASDLASPSPPGSTARSTCRSPRCARSSLASILLPSLVRSSRCSPRVPLPSPLRSIYVNPLDGLNLNRQFPGDRDGSPTQRLAHWLTTEVIAGSDAFVDMHCGDMNEALVSFTGIEETGDAAVDARSRELAEAYGLHYLLIGPSPGTTTTAAAALGIPAVLGEVGGQGRWPMEDVALHAAGFRRVLQAGGLIDAAPGRPRTAPRSCRRKHGCGRRRAATGTRPWRWVTESQPAPWWAKSRMRSAASSSDPPHPWMAWSFSSSALSL